MADKCYNECIMSTTQENEPTKKRVMPKWRIKRIVAGGIAVLLVVIGVIWLIQQLYQTNLQRIDTSKYQVVYLSNGQAYFGKLQNTGGDFLVMKSPYIAQSVKDSSSSSSSSSDTTTLLRVRDQVYGPDDSIAIKSSQVAFWQNLRDDSKVSQAIKAKTE